MEWGSFRREKLWKGVELKLYHYTDVSAVQSIIQNKKLWLTDMRFLNDTEELLDGISYVRKVLNGRHRKDDYFASFLDYVTNYYENHIEETANSFPFHTCSFSRHGDMLSQWRAYGSYAVEFDSELFDKKPVRCEYAKTNKIKRVREAIKEAEELVAQRMGKGPLHIITARNWVVVHLMQLAATFKNGGFREESEFRLLRNSIEAEVKYRSRANILIPYSEYDVSFRAITGIVVGPVAHQDLAFQSMSGYIKKQLKLFNESHSEEDHTIEVTKSAIPYRAP